MFRDLKEYQNLQKLYEEKVSKVENVNEENVRGANMKGSVNVGNMFKKIGDALKPKPIVRPQGSTSVRQSSVNTNKNVTPEKKMSNIPVIDGPINNPEFRKNMSRSKEDLNPSKVDTSNEIESDANYAKTNARFNQRFNKDVKIVRNSQMSGRQRAQEMAKKRIAAKEAGTYKKPKTAQELAKERIAAKEAGTYKKPKTAQELAKERIAAKEAGTYQKPKTAQELAKERIAAKQRLKDANIKVENYTPYDMVLEYLLSSEQATTIEEANYVMMQLDEENIQEIVRTIMKTPLVKLVPAAAATIATTKFVASKMGQKSGENQIKNSTTSTPVSDEEKKKGNFFTNFINKKRDESPLGGNKKVEDVRRGSGDNKVGEKIYFK